MLIRRRYAGALVAPQSELGGVGIDIERLFSVTEAQDVKHIAFTPSELEVLGPEGSCDSYRLALTLGFSAKEAFFKAAFNSVRRIFDFEVARLILLDRTERRLVFVLSETLNQYFGAGTKFEVFFDFIDNDTIITSAAWKKHQW